MKVYVLIEDYAYGRVKGVECVGVYDTKEKAQKSLEDEIDMTEKNWTEHWCADVIKFLKIKKGEGTGMIKHSGMHKYLTIVEREVK